MSRLDEITNRNANVIAAYSLAGEPQLQTTVDLAWFTMNTYAALAYIDRLLAGANSQQLMYLTRLRNILAGTDDGRPANEGEVSDAKS